MEVLKATGLENGKDDEGETSEEVCQEDIHAVREPGRERR